MSIEFIGMACALGLSAMGSAFGAGFAAQASVGAWKKCYANGKPAPFIMVAFSGAPLTQTIYGFLLMNFIRSAVASGADPALAMFTGIFAGLAIGLSAFFQGKVAAASADALGETGKDVRLPSCSIFFTIPSFSAKGAGFSVEICNVLLPSFHH